MDRQLPINGTCCFCGETEEDDGFCPESEDQTHCNHWWEGPDEEN